MKKVMKLAYLLMGVALLLSSCSEDIFPGGSEILDRVRGLPGCMGVAISGSGPTMIALVQGNPGAIAKEMCRTFSERGVPSQFFVLHGSSRGAALKTSIQVPIL